MNPHKQFPYPVPSARPLYLAPMAGVSESPFRRLCRAHGADVVVTEFLSAEGIRRENPATINKLRFGADERTIGVQIFGAVPEAMADAAAFVTDVFQPEFVDINFGCPVKKVVRRNGGSGCLRDLSLVTDVIKAVVKATHLPVTVKTRSGWSEEMRDPVRIGLVCQDAGARVLALHARTRTQMYSGSANWDEIAAVTEALDIPVLRSAVDLPSGARAARWAAHAGHARRRGALRDRARSCTHGAAVRGRSGGRRVRVPQAPWLVREGAAPLGRSAAAPAPRRVICRGGGDLRRLPA
ncbi:MAG: tRNA-dihydrouridine synthase family protein [Gemmatimonadaceae bacterium]|nr:tRNA-dihydrouridine synthase family protein [Gemmatimonadaceae bacterium]